MEMISSVRTPGAGFVRVCTLMCPRFDLKYWLGVVKG